MTFYKIGEVARLLGLTTQALRFYEQEGVVTPKKSENGTRYYDEDQLILLLSFKKYRQADFSVQDIVTHFKDDHLSGLREQILAQREALLKQSELLRRRADALDAFEKRLAYAQAHLDEPAICDRPPLRLLRPSLSELSAADMESRRSLDAFIAAMPDTRISFARALAPKSEKHFRLCADEAACAAWALPLEHTAGLPSARCVRVIHPPSHDSSAKKASAVSHTLAHFHLVLFFVVKHRNLLLIIQLLVDVIHPEMEELGVLRINDLAILPNKPTDDFFLTDMV